MAKSNRLHVSIITPETIVFEGDVKSVTSTNEKGPFDILPFHAHFVTLVKDRVILVDEKNVSKEFKVQAGILKVYDNNIYIFLGIQTEATQHP